MTAPEDADLEPIMSDDEHRMWEEAAQSLTPPHTLDRILTQQQFIVDNVTKVGTLLAGVSGITAAITITRTTWYWNGIPVIPAGTLITTGLAGLAVLMSLVARRPRFRFLNINDAYDVRAYYLSATVNGKRMLTVSWSVFLVAVLCAVATAVTAAAAAILDPPDDPGDGPNNRASFAAEAGEKGAVSVSLGGSITQIPEGYHAVVRVTADPQRPAGPRAAGRKNARIIGLVVHPDTEGTVELKVAAQVPSTSTHATARIVLVNPEGSRLGSGYTLRVGFARVP